MSEFIVKYYEVNRDENGTYEKLCEERIEANHFNIDNRTVKFMSLGNQNMIAAFNDFVLVKKVDEGDKNNV